ncbi:MAG: GTP cyclohydrolase [Bacteroidota bacterium]
MKNLKNYLLIGLLGMGFILTSCGDDDEVPAEENDPEVITDVTLVFTNTMDASDVVRASAQDPDDLGVQELMILDEITLTSGATYTLTFEILNALDPADVEDVGEEILDEDDEHQIFFSFTDGAFTSPMGDGNFDNPADPINYGDEDSMAQDGSGNPVGLETTWTAGNTLTDGFFTARLKHQPDQKTATSDINVGEDDFNLMFVLNIE